MRMRKQRICVFMLLYVFRIILITIISQGVFVCIRKRDILVSDPLRKM